MTQLVRTTITIPEDLLRQLKTKAVNKKISVSTLITNAIQKETPSPAKKRKKIKDPMKFAGVFSIGIDKIYDNRDELYDEDIKRHLGNR